MTDADALPSFAPAPIVGRGGDEVFDVRLQADQDAVVLCDYVPREGLKPFAVVNAPRPITVDLVERRVVRDHGVTAVVAIPFRRADYQLLQLDETDPARVVDRQVQRSLKKRVRPA